jgi:hypothetical protein
MTAPASQPVTLDPDVVVEAQLPDLGVDIYPYDRGLRWKILRPELERSAVLNADLKQANGISFLNKST